MTDSVKFHLFEEGDSCEVWGRSESQEVSFYDFETNYCNLWNVLFYAEGQFKVKDDSMCQWKPEDPTKHCVRAAQ